MIDAEPDERADHRAIDREHVAEQQRRRLGGERRVVVQKQQSETERQRQHHADGDVAAADALAHQSHADPGGDRETDQSPDRGHADQDGAGRPGKADMAERVTGKSLPAQHQEIAHQSRDDGRHACGGERVAHEIVFKHGGDDRDGRGRDRRRADGRRARRRARATARRYVRRRARRRYRRRRAATAPAP